MSSDPTEISASDFWLNVLDGALFPGGMAFMGAATVLLRFVASMTDSTPVVGMASAGVALAWPRSGSLRGSKF